jgi:hypothetical protein
LNKFLKSFENFFKKKKGNLGQSFGTIGKPLMNEISWTQFSNFWAKGEDIES